MVDTALIRDVVIVVPGIMGSELVDADGKALWSVSPGSLVGAIRALAHHKLTLPPGIGEGPARDGVRASALLDSLHVIPGLWSPVVGYDGMLGFLRSPRFHLLDADGGDEEAMPNLIPFPYDWRLSCRYNGRRLAELALPALERWRSQPGMEEAKLVLLCHSMGGLVARWFAEMEGGAGHIRAIVTIGTPHRGALKALTGLVNGLAPKLGPLDRPLTALARSLPSLYELLPQYPCVVKGDKRVSVLDAACPNLDPDMLEKANAFHAAINRRDALDYALHKVVGIRQPTPTTARLVDGRIEASNAIDGNDQGGDGTVPRLAAEPASGRGLEVHEVANQHGELQGTRSLLDLVDGILTRQEIIWQSAGASHAFGIAMEDVWCNGDEPVLQVTAMGDRRLRVRVEDESGRRVGDEQVVPVDGRVALGDLGEGGYRAIVQGPANGPPPVAKPFLVLA
jgi:pimeloyl-ACP methyl ester carboxylesterase